MILSDCTAESRKHSLQKSVKENAYGKQIYHSVVITDSFMKKTQFLVMVKSKNKAEIIMKEQSITVPLFNSAPAQLNRLRPISTKKIPLRGKYNRY